MKKTPFPSCQVLPHPPTSYDSYHPTDIHFNHQAPSSLEAFALVGDISFHLAQGMDCHDLVSHLIIGHALFSLTPSESYRAVAVPNPRSPDYPSSA